MPRRFIPRMGRRNQRVASPAARVDTIGGGVTTTPGKVTPVGFDVQAAIFNDLKIAQPVLMMPVRLETRFYTEDNATTLKIRIFPDQLWIDDHQDTLSQTEYEAGTRFWQQVDEDEAIRAQAWQDLLAELGSWRGAWVARQCQNGVNESKLRADNASAVATAPLMPERWFAVGYVDGERVFEAYSRTVPDGLAFSPDLNAVEEINDDISVDEHIRWMFDFDLAEQNGMAIRVTLPEEAKNGLDELYVLGIRTTDPDSPGESIAPQTAANRFERLLKHQLYTHGAGFVPQGMATNNTEEVSSGWSAFDADAEAIWQREFGEEKADPAGVTASELPCGGALAPYGVLPEELEEDKKNYRVLETALGLGQNSILKRYEYREGYEKPLMEAMNTALWPVSVGEYLGMLLTKGGDPYFSQDKRDWAQDWFRQQVKGGASLPALRIGASPYGILPAMAWSELSLKDADEKDLYALLEKFMTFWQAAKGEAVQIMQDAEDGATPGERLLELLCLQPHPSEFSAVSLYGDYRGVLIFFYLLIKMALTDMEVSIYAPIVDPLVATSLEDLGTRSFSSAEEQRDAYATLQREIEAQHLVYERLLDGMDDGDSGYEETQETYEALDGLLAQVELMNELLEDHALRATGLNLLDAPADMLSGIMEDDSPDPNIIYGSYSSTSMDWPTDRYTIVPEENEEETVYPDVYFAYLIAYARSFVNSNVSAGTSPFYGKTAPLLFQLLTAAIARVAADNDSSALLMNELLDSVRMGKDISAPDSVLMTASPAAVADLQRGMSEISSRPSLGVTLNGYSATEISTLSRQIDKASRSAAPTSGVSFSTFGGLSQSLESIAVGSGEIGDVSHTPVPIAINQRMSEMIAALELLATQDWQALDLLMRQTLGLAGWRLDAWYSSLYTSRLAGMREKRGKGLQLGAFGWLQDIAPRKKNTTPVSQGYIHTPSVNHATTASVLRAGWQAYGGDEDAEAMAVDLSSARMRTASWLFDAVRQGQDIGDALGYRFERSLHEAELDYWIAPVRSAVLEHSGAAYDPKSPTVDGMELLSLWDGGSGSAALAELAKPYFTGAPPDVSELEEALADLDDASDAMADAAIADSVHALVQGNPMRAGSSLASVSRGDVPPPQLQVIETGRKGMTLLHRVTALVQAENGAYGWFMDEASASVSPRALADPILEQLASSLVGGLEELAFEAEYVDVEGAVQATRSFTLAELSGDFALGAQDALALLEGDGLQNWLLAWLEAEQAEAGWQPRLVQPDGEDITAELNTTAHSLLRLTGWRDAIARARPLKIDDFIYQEEDAEGELALDAFEARATQVKDALDALLVEIEALLPEATDDDPQPTGDASEEALRSILLVAARYDLPQAIPATGIAAETRQAYYYARLWSAYSVLTARRDAAEQITLDATATDDMRIKAARSYLQAMLGETMKCCIGVRPVNQETVMVSFAKSADRLGGDDTVPAQWLEKIQHVRPSLKAFSEALLVQDALCLASGGAAFSIGQWPDIEGEGWTAMQVPDDTQKGRMSMLAALPEGESIEAMLADGNWAGGLLLDEVVERLPVREEDTGLALHFDAPNAEAPQTMLLAMAPKGGEWSFDLMVTILRDTLEMVRLRVLDGENIRDFDHHLPAVFGGKYLNPGTVEETA